MKCWSLTNTATLELKGIFSGHETAVIFLKSSTRAGVLLGSGARAQMSAITRTPTTKGKRLSGVLKGS